MGLAVYQGWVYTRKLLGSIIFTSNQSLGQLAEPIGNNEHEGSTLEDSCALDKRSRQKDGTPMDI